MRETGFIHVCVGVFTGNRYLFLMPSVTAGCLDLSNLANCQNFSVYKEHISPNCLSVRVYLFSVKCMIESPIFELTLHCKWSTVSYRLITVFALSCWSRA